MVELPLDDAATRYEKLAEKVNDIRFGLDTSELDGAVAEALMASAVGLNEFTSRTAEILMEQANAVRVQHAEDEALRDAPKPSEVRELEQKAQQLAVIARYSVNPTAVAMAETAARAAAEKRLEREIALSKHTSAAATNAPRLLMEPPSLSGIGAPGTGNSRTGGDYRDGGGINNLNPQWSSPGTTDKIGTGGGGDKIGPGGGGDKLGPGGGSPISDTGVNTETSSDMMGSGAPQQAMMGQPQAGAQQQPTTPAGAQGAGTPAGGNMLSNNSAANAARNRRRDDKRDGSMDLSSGGVVGAVPMGGPGGVDRGVSLSGVTTDKDTTGRVGQTNLSAGGAKPGDGGNAPRGNMMRGGMMGGMGGMGSGAQGGTNVKSKADNPIMSALKDRYLHGFDSIREGVEGGMVGRETADTPTLDGTDRFLDDGKTKPNNPVGA